MEIYQVAFHMAVIFGIYNTPLGPEAGCKSQQTCSVPVTAALCPTETTCVCIFFLRRGRLLRYLKSVFFVMTFIIVCWDIWGYQGLGKGQMSKPAKVSSHVGKDVSV